VNPDFFSEVTELSANICLEALDNNAECWHQFWHIDNHPKCETPPQEAHPLFHVHFGGARLENCRKASNNTLFRRLAELHAPRIQLPPMDIILLIDFIISNFDGEKWNSLRGNPGYMSLIWSSQKRMWHHYIRTISDYFETPYALRSAHDAIRLWPNLAISQS
jgi:hypothetical protein